MSTALVWLRRDLRIADNPALLAACAAHTRVLPVYVHAPEEEAPWQPGGASRWWLHHSLGALSTQLKKSNGELFIARGESLAELIRLVEGTGAAAVYWNRLYEPAIIARDTRIKTALRARGIAAESHAGNLWCEPWQISTAEDQPYRVFTPFWRKLRTRIEPAAPLPPGRPKQWAHLEGSLSLDALQLLPKIRWDQGLEQTWKPGESAACEMLELFADDALADYARGRDLPSRNGTSRLSPHLHFGEITPRQIHHALQQRARERKHLDLEPFLRELGWREFAHHLLYHFPQTPTRNFNPKFDGFPWARKDTSVLGAWTRGRTGIPLVDAGMRELWATGWMHNRVRMVVASFLTKNLRQHWLYGARWFWDTLVDADLANNTLGWQWVAGSGADAAPYFRVFNPLTQARKFDPDAKYLRRWLPELAEVPAEVLFDPSLDPTMLRACGYPEPIADLGESRRTALEAYEKVKTTAA